MKPQLLRELNGDGYLALAHDVSDESRDEKGQWTAEHISHYEKVISHAKKQFYGKPTADQVENVARNYWFNNSEAQKLIPSDTKYIGHSVTSKGLGGYKAYAKYVREHFEKHHLGK